VDVRGYHLGERGFVLGEGLPLSGDGSACFGIDRFLVSFALHSYIINNSRIKLEPRCNTHTHTQVLPEATHVLGDQFQQWCAVLLIVVWCVPRRQANGEAGPG